VCHGSNFVHTESDSGTYCHKKHTFHSKKGIEALVPSVWNAQLHLAEGTSDRTSQGRLVNYFKVHYAARTAAYIHTKCKQASDFCEFFLPVIFCATSPGLVQVHFRATCSQHHNNLQTTDLFLRVNSLVSQNTTASERLRA